MENWVPFLIRKVKARENIVIFFIRMWIGNVRKFMYMMVLRKLYLSIRWMEYTSINSRRMSISGNMT